MPESLYDIMDSHGRPTSKLEPKTQVRINGNSHLRIPAEDGKNDYGVWSVEIRNDDGKWVMVSTLFGPSSLYAAVSYARDLCNGTVPSPLDSMEFISQEY